ncbi:ABC transporter permease [Nonomuraea sp. NBC_01738]|uniref:ABC transporter permease n=1 Tax=Nonomuraea sp. NBC_01738 TaxID=2976003 RepID=UPI002E0DAC13|nr:ABC transporter permease [Nonomuraea sp. NBC_01738]
MIWLTWRQFRGAAALMSALLVVLAAVLALTGPGLASSYTSGLAACLPKATCDRFFDQFFGDNQLTFLAVTLVVLVLPTLIGLFWGAPMITRELEANTHLLVWNQSITRGRWLATKLGVIGLAAVAAAGVAGLAVTWWSGPLDRSAEVGYSLMDPLVFSARGIAPMGYAAFALLLGVTVGMLARRTLPAMAITLVLFAAVQVGLPLLLRPHLMAPVNATFPLSRANIDQINVPGDGHLRIHLDQVIADDPGAWVLSTQLVDSAGRAVPESEGGAEVSVSGTSGPCGPPPRGAQPETTMNTCLAEVNRAGYRQAAVYHPWKRFWPMQWIETGLYALLTLGLSGFCVWWLRRRLS